MYSEKTFAQDGGPSNRKHASRRAFRVFEGYMPNIGEYTLSTAQVLHCRGLCIIMTGRWGIVGNCVECLLFFI